MNGAREHDLVVVGAGIAGLSLARESSRGGLATLVLERAAGVGGRCATRRVGGWPVDHGTPFLHGRDPEFVAALEAVRDATPIPGWPRIRSGGGVPCQPEAFEGRDSLFAFREGISRFPKHLARGLDVRLGANVTGLRQLPGEAAIEVSLAGGAPSLRARAVALTMPVPSAASLLASLLPDSPALAEARPVWEQVRTLPCLAVIARYGADAPAPAWDVCYPRDSTMVHAILHDTTKRHADAPRTLVVQGRPRFSREYLDAPREEWRCELLWEAGEFAGAWVERPEETQEHVWHYARVEPATELTAPLAVRLENGSLLALCGDGFSPHGGAEAAYRSGRSLAARIQGGSGNGSPAR